MTLAEKILAAHCGKKKVRPGEIVMSRVDVIMTHDGSAPMAIREFRRLGVKKVFDPKRIILICDHFVPNADADAAENTRLMREFAREHGVTFYELGRSGNCHILMPEEGWVLPGDVSIGADSHSCTYGAVGAFATGVGMVEIATSMATGEIWFKVPPTLKFVYHGRLPKWVGGKDLILHTIHDIGVDGARYAAMEFSGEAITQLPIDGRLTMANMVIEAGAKVGIFPADAKLLRYVNARAKRPFQVYEPNPDAQYQKVTEYDVSKLEPQVAFPELPSNARPISQAGKIEVDQAVVGSCTNGRLDDLRLAARVLKGRKLHPRVRMIVTPGTSGIYEKALREGLIRTFVEAGAALFTPGCGVCSTSHPGILGQGETAVSTTNRNFKGRMGTGGTIYLANPAVVAASAVMGRIANPEEVVGD